MSIFEIALESFIDMNHELVLLSKQIDWSEVESEFAEYYCAENGCPSVDRYLERLIAHKGNGRVKIVTGTPLYNGPSLCRQIIENRKPKTIIIFKEKTDRFQARDDRVVKSCKYLKGKGL